MNEINETFLALGLTMPELGTAFWLNIGAFLILGFAALVNLVQSCYPSLSGRGAVKTVVLSSLAASFAWLAMLMNQPEQVLIGGPLIADHFGRFCGMLIVGISFVVALIASRHHTAELFFRGEFACVFMVVTLGSLAMVMAGDMVTFYVGLEASSIGLYCLVGYIKPSRQSEEGAIKYLILGSFASGFLLFGLALLYASGGTLIFSELFSSMQFYASHTWVGLGVLMTVAGLAFKLALVPFHLWAPDAYEAAPTPVTALMATAGKVAVLAVMVRIFSWGNLPIAEHWLPLVTVMAMVSVLVANVMALVQTSLKRMLAYSSVAHSGYMAFALCGISVATGSFPVTALLFYLISYSIMTLGAFAVLSWLESESCENIQLNDLAGLAKKYPMAAFALAAFMFSFAGLPPSAGFIAKFLVFSAAIQAQLYGLVIVGAIGSAIALYYYLRVIVRMYLDQDIVSLADFKPRPSRLIVSIASVSLALTIAFGTVAPNFLIKMSRPSAESLVD